MLGHGSYMGPDYTAEALKIYTEAMQNFRSQEKYQKDFHDLNKDDQSIVRERVKKEMRENRYD